MTQEELSALREKCYGMSVANLNPEDVVDYMAIASAAARMESRNAARAIPPEGGWKEPA
jgi:hypothetical protein